ncbi:hypothetical protein AOQ84DRAFT_442662 [Glonium stellatum]|uniref:Uncharacterized protein n=1 Tax=Glonium stellatum TaxID=574774 RepID=A0A8E2ESI7_9PEZI|nr:hypothetical protein AOQ84DRAFT_442662 [Glonium stellatum]
MDTQQCGVRPVPSAKKEQRTTPEPEIQFITFNDPKGFKDAATQKLIRKRVMGRAGRIRRLQGTKREKAKISLDVRPPQNCIEQERSAASDGLIPAMSQSHSATFDWLGAGEVDPFVRTIFRATGANQRALRDAWYPVGLSDMAAFHIVLSNSAAHLHIMRNGLNFTREDIEDTAHQALAIRSVNERLTDPKYRYIVGAFNKWNIHMNGLREIIKLRGGVSNIMNEELRLTLSWAELCGAYSQDIKPQFSLPSAWLPYVDTFPVVSPK